MTEMGGLGHVLSQCIQPANILANKVPESKETQAIKSQKGDYRDYTQWSNGYYSQANNSLKKTITCRNFPVWNPSLIGQELIDMLAVSLKQVLAISDSNDHCAEFIRIERKKGTGKAWELNMVLPKTALGGNR
jgi:hypothetical protein